MFFYVGLLCRSSFLIIVFPGKWEDLKLGSDCRTATSNFVFTGYTDAPADFGDTWLAGNISWVADEVEVYYVPELADASSPLCTLAAPSQPPTTAVPTTTAPTYDGETDPPTTAPSSSAPTVPPTPAPATGSPTASPEGSPDALGILHDMMPRIIPIDASESPYRGFLDLRLVRGGTMHSPATVWSAVCGTGWTEVNSEVACRQMGLRGGRTYRCPDCEIDSRPVQCLRHYVVPPPPLSLPPRSAQRTAHTSPHKPAYVRTRAHKRASTLLHPRTGESCMYWRVMPQSVICDALVDVSC